MKVPEDVEHREASVDWLERVEVVEEGVMFPEKKKSILITGKIINCGLKNLLPVKVSLISRELIKLINQM
jgi:hypothetical protein